MAKKSSLTQIVIKYYNIIKQQYSFKVAIIYIDREMSLIGEFKEWAAKQGISIKRLAPNT